MTCPAEPETMSESKRKLTKAEEKRVILFNETTAALEQQGYRKIDLTASVLKANIVGVLYTLILAIPFIVVFGLTNKESLSGATDDNFLLKWSISLLVMLLLIVVHELIHGITWAAFTKERFQSIEFGVIWKMLTPYCTCKEPLKRIPYILGGIMPCIVLGFIPCIISWFTHSFWLLIIGVFMILAAGGDVLICKMILSNKTAPSALYLDHPTDLGLRVFVK